MEAHEIVHGVQEAHRGLAVRLARITDHSEEWFRSHGREPKSENPLQSGNASPVTHYLRYARQYEAAVAGAGKQLNRQVFAELENDFAERDPAPRPATSQSLHTGILKEAFDVLRILNECDFGDVSPSELARFEREGAELRDAASDFIAHVRALRRLSAAG